METINFRYTEDIDVTISQNTSSRNIFFKQNGKTFLKVMFRGYFYAIEFAYDIFGNRCPGLDYVRMTAKDGSAFLARIYVNGTFYIIRKKKKKPQIIFVKSNHIKNFQLGKDVFDAVCYYNGAITKDESIVNDFFEKRQTIEFDEQKYIDSLDPEDKKEYLDEKRIDEIVERVGKKNKIEKERIEDLAFFVKCMSDEDDIKNKVLNSNDIDEVASLILPLIKKAKDYCEKIDALTLSHDSFQNLEYTFDSRFIYSESNLDSINIKLSEDERYVEELFWFFEDEYEQVKDYLNKGIERTKKTIDEALPFFKQYCEETTNK